jgi:hypothetical protein
MIQYDITFCTSEKCKRKDKCARHTSVLNGDKNAPKYLSTSDFSETQPCRYFLNIKKNGGGVACSTAR